MLLFVCAVTGHFLRLRGGGKLNASVEGQKKGSKGDDRGKLGAKSGVSKGAETSNAVLMDIARR
jgi:hypothetical protein